MKVAQLLGTNGSGKSTVFRTLAAGDPAVAVVGGLTYLPNVAGVLVGDYCRRDVSAPGVDTLRGKAAILQALDAAFAAAALGYTWIGWEGIIILTRQYHPEILARGGRPYYFLLTTPLDLCFQRIEARSGKGRAALKRDGQIVANRQRGIFSLAKWLAAQEAPLVMLSGEGTPHVWVTAVLGALQVCPRRTAL